MDSASSSAFFTNTGVCLALVFAAALTVLSFTAITIQFVVAMVESYIIVAAGIIFVGFGGSRWTAPYVERYIGLGVSIGVKIMLLYLLIGSGMSLSLDWMDAAQAVGTSSKPAMSAFEIMGASLIFMMLCWQIPKLFAAVLGGSPALSGGDLVAAGGTVAAGALMLGSAAAAGAGAHCRRRWRRCVGAGGGGAGAAAGAGGGSGMTTMSAGAGASVPPPSAGSTERRNQRRKPARSAQPKLGSAGDGRRAKPQEHGASHRRRNPIRCCSAHAAASHESRSPRIGGNELGIYRSLTETTPVPKRSRRIRISPPGANGTNATAT